MWLEAINDRSDNIHEKAGSIVKALLTPTAETCESISAIVLFF